MDSVLAIPIMIEIVTLILKNLFKSLSKSIGCVRETNRILHLQLEFEKKGCQICAPIIPVLIDPRVKTTAYRKEL